MTLPRSASSSVYSCVPPYETTNEGPADHVRYNKNPVLNDQESNPYSHSLWYDSRGEIGNESINKIRERVSKRKREEIIVKPPRLESFGRKKTDSPIKNESFVLNNGGLFCESPIYKTIGLKFNESEYRNAFKEFIDTELKYLNNLKLVDSVYRDMLHNTKKYKYILSKDQEAVIFSNIDTIIELSDLLIKQITKSAKAEFRNHLNIELQKHFDFVNIENINLGEILKSLFVRFKIVYASYYMNFEAQMTAILDAEKHGGPKVSKWLEECSYLARSRSECSDFQSLLMKPIQRLTKYVLLINALLEASNDDIRFEFVNDLYDAKTELEKLMDSLDKKETSMEKRSEEKHSMPKTYTLDRADYIKKVQGFKQQYSFLTAFKKEVEKSLEPLLSFILNQKQFVSSWKNFMELDDPSSKENIYISSIYSIYLDKITDQEGLTKLMIQEIKQQVIKAVELALEHCLVVKTKINQHNSNRGAYATYLKNSESSKNFYNKVSAKDAQEYIVIENQIRDELPLLLDSLSKFSHYISLLYHSLILKWFMNLAGQIQIEQYQELLKSKEMGDNFDIIEMFCYNRNTTKEALQDICHRSNEPFSIFYSNSFTNTDSKISASRVVRKLFGI